MVNFFLGIFFLFILGCGTANKVTSKFSEADSNLPLGLSFYSVTNDNCTLEIKESFWSEAVMKVTVQEINSSHTVMGRLSIDIDKDLRLWDGMCLIHSYYWNKRGEYRLEKIANSVSNADNYSTNCGGFWEPVEYQLSFKVSNGQIKEVNYLSKIAMSTSEGIHSGPLKSVTDTINCRFE